MLSFVACDPNGERVPVPLPSDLFPLIDFILILHYYQIRGTGRWNRFLIMKVSLTVPQNSVWTWQSSFVISSFLINSLIRFTSQSYLPPSSPSGSTFYPSFLRKWELSNPLSINPCSSCVGSGLSKISFPVAWKGSFTSRQGGESRQQNPCQKQPPLPLGTHMSLSCSSATSVVGLGPVHVWSSVGASVSFSGSSWFRWYSCGTPVPSRSLYPSTLPLGLPVLCSLFGCESQCLFQSAAERSLSKDSYAKLLSFPMWMDICPH